MFPVPTGIAVMVLGAITLLAAYSLLRGTSGQPLPAAGESPEKGVVECPHCGTENERGYRFCRECVGDLPGDRDVARSGRFLPRSAFR